MTTTVSEPMARRIFELAVETGQSARLLDLLFNGGSVTVDAVTGRLVMIPAEALAEMANTEPPESAGPTYRHPSPSTTRGRWAKSARTRPRCSPVPRSGSTTRTSFRRETVKMLVRDLAATLRAEMRRWANARGDAVDYSLRADDLEAIVRDLAKIEPVAQYGEPTLHGEWNACELCGERNGVAGDEISHRADCPWLRAEAWVSAHPVSGTETGDEG